MARRLPLVLWALLCLVLAMVVVRSTSFFLRNIPWQTVGSVALITAVVVLLVWFLWSPTRRGYTGGAMRSRWLWWPVVILLLIAIGIGAYEKYGYFSRPKAPATSSSLPRLPAEVALPIIAECESRGQQFNSDGSIVTNNNTDGTIDRGKWQINSRHDERAKRLGIDILTEEGNEKFARILYAENYLRDWEASRHCWESQLIAKATALGLTASTTTVPPTTDTTFVVTVQSGQPAEVKMTPGQMIVWWGDKTKFTSHAIWRDENKVRIFVARPGAGHVEIKIHRYYDSDPNWWRRQ